MKEQKLKDQKKIEKILGRRKKPLSLPGEDASRAGEQKEDTNVNAEAAKTADNGGRFGLEYLVKWAGVSYLHLE